MSEEILKLCGGRKMNIGPALPVLFCLVLVSASNFAPVAVHSYGIYHQDGLRVVRSASRLGRHQGNTSNTSTGAKAGSSEKPQGTSPNSAVMPSVSFLDLAFGYDRSSLEKDIAAVFSKVAYGSTTQPSNATNATTGPNQRVAARLPDVKDGAGVNIPQTFSRPSTTPTTTTTTTTTIRSTTTTTSTTSASTASTKTATTVRPLVPEYVPPSRTRFKPPLPPEYTNPFANKPILRGSQSEGSIGGARRSDLPPPPRPGPPEKERIPYRPPELLGGTTEGKKPLNTPANVGQKPSRGQPFGNLPTFMPPRENAGSHVTYADIERDNNPPSNRVTEQESRPINDTEFDFVPVLKNPTVTRILSGSSGRKQQGDDLLIPPVAIPPPPPSVYSNRNNHFGVSKNSTDSKDDSRNDKDTSFSGSRTNLATSDTDVSGSSSSSSSDDLLDNVNKDSIIDVKPESAVSPSASNPQFPPLQPERPEEEPKLTPDEPEVAVIPSDKGNHPFPEPDPEWHSARNVWGVAWDIHIYLMASLFTILALYSAFNIIRINAFSKLLTKGYFFTLNCLLFLIGTFRSFYLFYDAYNIHLSYPPILASFLYNIIYPCLTSAFAIIFQSLLQSTKVQFLNSKTHSPALLIIIIIIHFIFSICVDVIVGTVPEAKFLMVIFQSVFILWCIVLSLAYLYAFNALYRAALRKQGEVIRATFTKMHIEGAALPRRLPRPTLGLAVRVTLAIAMLCILMAAVQIYGMFGVYGILSDRQLRPWPWWGFQFSVRVIEVSVCYLMSFVGIQPLRHYESGEEKDRNEAPIFSLFACSGTPLGCGLALCSCTSTPPEENKTVEDLYPTICSTNHAIRNYALQTGKKVYDDSFPLSNLHGSGLGDGMIPVNAMSKRRSMKKSGTLLSSMSEGQAQNLQTSLQTLSSSNTSRPSSMLFAENGFVRFRTSADPEQHMEEVLHQSSISRKGVIPGIGLVKGATRMFQGGNEDEGVTAFNISTTGSSSTPHYKSIDSVNFLRHHATQLKVTEVQIEQSKLGGAVKYKPRGSIDATTPTDTSSIDALSSCPPSRGATSSQDIHHLKYASTCSSESAANSFDVRMFPIHGGSGYEHVPEELVGVLRGASAYRSLGRVRSRVEPTAIHHGRQWSTGRSLPERRVLVSPGSHLGVHSVENNQKHHSLRDSVSPVSTDALSRSDVDIDFLTDLHSSGDHLPDLSDSDLLSSVEPSGYEDNADDEQDSDGHSRSQFHPSHSTALNLNLRCNYEFATVVKNNPSSSQDVTPDSAVVADISDCSKNEEPPVENSYFLRYSGAHKSKLCDSSPPFRTMTAHPSVIMAVPLNPNAKSSDVFQTGSDLPSGNSVNNSFRQLRGSKGLLQKLKGSNFSLNGQHNGYSPLDSDDVLRHDEITHNLKRSTSDNEVKKINRICPTRASYNSKPVKSERPNVVLESQLRPLLPPPPLPPSGIHDFGYSWADIYSPTDVYRYCGDRHIMVPDEGPSWTVEEYTNTDVSDPGFCEFFHPHLNDLSIETRCRKPSQFNNICPESLRDPFLTDAGYKSHASEEESAV